MKFYDINKLNKFQKIHVYFNKRINNMTKEEIYNILENECKYFNFIRIVEFIEDLLVVKEQYGILTEENEKLKENAIHNDKVVDKAIEYIENEIKDGRSKDNLWLMGCYDEDKKILDILRG